MHRNTFEAVDKSFRDIMKQIDPALEKVPFGGKIMVFGGDFRQVAPVIRRASRAVIGAASLRMSHSIWPHMQQHRLTINKRVDNMGEYDKAEHLAFAELLLRVGDGTETVYPEFGEDYINIPEEMSMPTEKLEDLIKHVYPIGDEAKLRDPEHIMHRAILTPKNSDVHDINNAVMELFPGEVSMI